MTHAVHFNVYKLKKGVDATDFLAAFDTLVATEISKKNGFVSCELMSDGETWVDNVRFETEADLAAFEEAAQNPSEAALHFYSFINFSAKGNRHAKLTVAKSF